MRHQICNSSPQRGCEVEGHQIFKDNDFIINTILDRDCPEKNETDILGSSQFYKGFSQIYYRIYQIF